jgi:flagellar basal-body rod protein FlgG
MNSIYGTPLTGMRGADFQLDVVSNNIANLNTSGFQAVDPILGSLEYEAAIGDPNNGSTPSPTTRVGMGVRPAEAVRSQDPAPLVATGNPLDLAISGPGLFVLRQADGQLGYTKELSLHLAPDGKLVTAQGLVTVPPIQVPATVMHVSVDGHGNLVGEARDGTQKALVKLTVVTFPAPENLRAQGGGLYTESLGSGRPQTGAGTQTEVHSGFQLGSTVDLSTEMVDLIQAQRLYEINGKALQTMDSLVNTAITMQTR